MFLKEFRLICNKQVPEWMKYRTLYNQIACCLLISGSSNAKTESKERKDAL